MGLVIVPEEYREWAALCNSGQSSALFSITSIGQISDENVLKRAILEMKDNIDKCDYSEHACLCEFLHW
jgi:hypothetical protein